MLVDENGLSMDSLQSVTHHLCFGHQIVFSPTSLPTPVYVATEYVGFLLLLNKFLNSQKNLQAKRGRNNYNTWINTSDGQHADLSHINDYVRLTTDLSFKDSVFLKYLRVNAWSGGGCSCPAVELWLIDNFCLLYFKHDISIPPLRYFLWFDLFDPPFLPVYFKLILIPSICWP